MDHIARFRTSLAMPPWAGDPADIGPRGNNAQQESDQTDASRQAQPRRVRPGRHPAANGTVGREPSDARRQVVCHKLHASKAPGTFPANSDLRFDPPQWNPSRNGSPSLIRRHPDDAGDIRRRWRKRILPRRASKPRNNMSRRRAGMSADSHRWIEQSSFGINGHSPAPATHQNDAIHATLLLATLSDLSECRDDLCSCRSQCGDYAGEESNGGTTRRRTRGVRTGTGTLRRIGTASCAFVSPLLHRRRNAVSD